MPPYRSTGAVLSRLWRKCRIPRVTACDRREQPLKNKTISSWRSVAWGLKHQEAEQGRRIDKSLGALL